MGNKINIGNNNRMKDTNIAGNNVIISKEGKKNNFWLWVLKHLEAIISAVISGAVSALVAWLITYLCLK